jgi:hypothetical protein
MQQLKHKKTIRENLTKSDLNQVNHIESKFKGSVCLVGLINTVSKSNVGYYPINAVLDEQFSISRIDGQLSTIPSVVGG